MLDAVKIVMRDGLQIQEDSFEFIDKNAELFILRDNDALNLPGTRLISIFITYVDSLLCRHTEINNILGRHNYIDNSPTRRQVKASSRPNDQILR